MLALEIERMKKGGARKGAACEQTRLETEVRNAGAE